MNEMPRSGRFAAKSKRSEAPAPQSRIGVLLINLGTPDGTSYWPMRRYLKEFLSDRRVIETNRVLWWLILNFVVLVKRPFASGAKYRSIWNEELDESPLRTITRSQAEKVSKALYSKSSSSIGPCVTARRRCLARGGARRPGLRPADRLSALSPICRGEHRDRQ